MKILGCHIDNFGNLQNLDVQLVDGLNIAVQENGWGKSTFAAFLRIMFYGFRGEGRRKTEENERMKYMPWQGGTFGGQLVFRAGGRTYRIERTFGSRPAEDTFALFDDSTNMPSRDFSSSVGEELFGMNHESFLRTVFIAQQDVPSRVTDDIHARIGGPDDDASDMNRYEEAQKRLKRRADRLNPGRVTGAIYKKNSHLTELTAVIAQTRARQKEAERLALSVSKEEARQRKLSESLDTLQKKSELAGRPLNRQRRLDQYRSLCDRAEEAQRQEEQLLSSFPEHVPELEEADDRLDELGELEAMNSHAQRCALTANEADELAELTLRYHGHGHIQADMADPDLSDSLDFRDYLDYAEDMDHKGGWKHVLVWLFFFFGIAAALAGYFFFRNRDTRLGMIITAAGGVAAAVSLAGRFLLGSRQNGERFHDRADVYDDEIRRYNELLQQKAEYDSVCRDIGRTKNDLTSFLQSQGISADFTGISDLRDELMRLRDRIRDLNRARSETDTCEEERDAFAEKYNITEEERSLLFQDPESGEQADGTDSGEDLAGSIRRVTEEAARSRETVHSLQEQLEAAQNSLNECLAARDRYEEESQALEAMQDEYNIITKASEYLSKAKDAYSSHYMKPILDSFRACFRILTGGEEADFEINSDLEIMLRAYGMLHPVRSLSEGWQDLIALCRRIALVEAMYPGEKPFLILDDPFVNLDTVKVKGGMELLRDLAGDYQILYFTCSESRC